MELKIKQGKIDFRKVTGAPFQSPYQNGNVAKKGAASVPCWLKTLVLTH